MRLAREQDFGPFMKITGDRAFVFGQRAWRIDKKLAGGGAMMDLGIYIVHGACMAANGAAPIFVTAHEEPKQKPELFNEVEETLRFSMEFPNGAKCDAITSFNQNADTFRAEGAKGWIEFKQHAFTYRGIVAEASRGPLLRGDQSTGGADGRLCRLYSQRAQYASAGRARAERHANHHSDL